VARRHGYPDIRAFVRDQTQAGLSLAATSRAAGLHKDWLARHLCRLDPAAQAAGQQGTDRHDGRWLPALRGLGFADVAGYLQDRHARQHWTVNAIAAEVGVSYHAVETALRRHGLVQVAHAAQRHAAAQRAAAVAASLGCDTIAAYVAERRAVGWTWRAMAAESGQPQTWLRRHGAADTGAAETGAADTGAADTAARSR
jgi:AraC-like DNA-binding protein